MHLWWHGDRGAEAGPSVSATLEVVTAPSVARLYFWALQATFVDRWGRPIGGAHLGLQWYAAHPGSTAVNWGGYRSGGGGELTGDPSPLPSATGNPNTRDFPWRADTPYRLRIDADGTGSVTDLGTGEATVVRRLHVDGAVTLRSPVVWSEVFARCDDPTTTVRWSDLDPTPARTDVTYQPVAEGGCSNTSVDADGAGGYAQTTNTIRRADTTSSGSAPA